MLLLFQGVAAPTYPPLSSVNDGPFTLVAGANVHTLIAASVPRYTLIAAYTRNDTLAAGPSKHTLTSNGGRNDTLTAADTDYEVEGR